MQNQTEELCVSEPANDGTGVFVFPEGQTAEFADSDWTQSFKTNRFGPLQKVLVRNIPYADCVERGERNWMIAYKWVPQTLASYEVVLAAAAHGCSGQPCVRRCAAFGCVCISGACR